MPFVMRGCVLLALVAGVFCAPVAAQEKAEPATPSPKELLVQFGAEREAAVKAKFPAETMARADDLVKRGEAAMKADNPKAAARYFRDARWQLPYLPPGLPEHVVRVLGESRMRHADRVNALAYSLDGTRLATCSKDGTVKVWDLANGREVSTYRGHPDQPDDPTKGGTVGGGTNVLGVTDVTFHPKDPKIIASGCGNQVHLWNPETGKIIKTLVNLGKTDKPIKAIAFSPDGTLLAVGADDGILRIVESDTGKVKYTSPTRNARIEKIAFAPNGKLVATGDSNSQVAVYAVAAPNALAMVAQGVDSGGVMGVAFTADSGAVFTSGGDSKARLIAGPKSDGTPGNATTRLKEFTGHTGAVAGLAVVGDGSLLVTGGDDKSVRVWEATTGKQIRMLQGHLAKVTAVAARADGKQIASASDDGSVRVWDLNASDDHRALAEAEDSLWAVAFSPDGKRVAAAGADKSIRVYNPETGKLETTLKGAKSPITSLAFLPDSNRLIAAGGDQVVVVWDVEKEKVLKELPGHESAVLSVAVTDDGKLVLSGSADKTVRAFTPEGDKAVWTWSGRSAVCAVAVRKGNKYAAVGLADGTLVTLDISGAAPKETSQSAHVAGVSCAAYSPDGNRLATVGGDGSLRIWTVAADGAPTPLLRFDGQAKPGMSGTFSPLTGVAFAPDGRYVAAVGADSVVRVWDIQTKSEVRGLRGHTDWVTAVAFSPDGRHIASVGVEKDKILRIFELTPLETTGSGGHMRAVNAVAVAPNGKTIATAGTDQTIKLWDIATGKEVGTLIGNADIPFGLAFLGNDALVMGSGTPLGDAGRLYFWSLNPGRLTATVQTGEVYTATATADGSKVAAWASRQAVNREVKNNNYELYDDKGKLLSTKPDQGRKVKAAIFTPDLSWVVAGDEQGAIRIWDLDKKEPPIKGDWAFLENAVGDLGITPDKKTLVAVDDKGTVKIGDVAGRSKLAEFSAHKGGVRALLVSPTGTTFVTIGNEREIKVWSLAAGDLKEPKATRTWAVPVGVNGAAYTPDGKFVVTANADGTAYVLELP